MSSLSGEKELIKHPSVYKLLDSLRLQLGPSPSCKHFFFFFNLYCKQLRPLYNSKNRKRQFCLKVVITCIALTYTVSSSCPTNQNEQHVPICLVPSVSHLLMKIIGVWALQLAGKLISGEN